MMKRAAFLFILMSYTLLGEVVAIATHNFDPFIVLENGKTYGSMVEIVDAAFAKKGITTKYVEYPWARTALLTEVDKMDVVMPKIVTPERLKNNTFSDPVIMTVNRFFYIKGRKIPENYKWDKFSDMRNLRVGGVLGYWYEEEFKEAGLDVDYTASNEQNLEKLYLGRIDTFVIDEQMGWKLIRKMYPKEISRFSVMSKTESVTPFCLMTYKGNKRGVKMIKEFNEGLKELKKSGEYDRIMRQKKWGDGNAKDKQ